MDDPSVPAQAFPNGTDVMRTNDNSGHDAFDRETPELGTWETSITFLNSPFMLSPPSSSLLVSSLLIDYVPRPTFEPRDRVSDRGTPTVE